MITLAAGMEIDFGGIGKEYAVDRAATLLSDLREPETDAPVSFVVNFGGDLYISGWRRESARG